MIKFSKLAIDDLTSIKKWTIGCIGCVLCASAVSFGFEWIETDVANLESVCKELHSKQVEISTLKDSCTNLHNTLQNMAYEQSTITSKEDIVITLGECAQKAGCAIVGMNSRMSHVDRSITRYNFTFEVKSDMAHIAKLLSQIDSKGLHYAINELSLRQSADYLWLQRDFEDSISWWDVSNISTGSGGQAKPQLSSEEIMSDNEMKFYFDLDFIIISEML